MTDSAENLINTPHSKHDDGAEPNCVTWLVPHCESKRCTWVICHHCNRYGPSHKGNWATRPSQPPMTEGESV